MKILRALSFTGGLLASVALAQAQSQSFSVNFAKDASNVAQPAAAGPVADSMDTVKVVARGTGMTREAALKDAYRFS